jgi:hypothetical protein
MTINIHEAKTQLSRLVEQAAKGRRPAPPSSPQLLENGSATPPTS